MPGRGRAESALRALELLHLHGPRIMRLDPRGARMMTSEQAQTEVYLEVGRKKVLPGRSIGRAGAGARATRGQRWRCRWRTHRATPRSSRGRRSTSYRQTTPPPSRSSSDSRAPARPILEHRTSRPRATRSHLTRPRAHAPEAILAAIWRAFDRAVKAAEGKELRKRPPAAVAAVRRHRAARPGSRRGVSAPPRAEVRPGRRGAAGRRAAADARGDPRGAGGRSTRGDPGRGAPRRRLWTPRYFVRRIAWHTVDHLWEIEDRIV